jgi:hypothetical protein
MHGSGQGPLNIVKSLKIMNDVNAIHGGRVDANACTSHRLLSGAVRHSEVDFAPTLVEGLARTTRQFDYRRRRPGTILLEVRYPSRVTPYINSPYISTQGNALKSPAPAVVPVLDPVCRLMRLPAIDRRVASSRPALRRAIRPRHMAPRAAEVLNPGPLS